MIQPNARTIKALAHIKQNVPAVEEWLEEWFATEINRLPQTISNVAIAQGRCQVLGEICNTLKKAPELAAQSNEG